MSRKATAAVKATEVQVAPETAGTVVDRTEIAAMVCSPVALNLREGPGKEFSVRAVLPDGESVTVCPLPYGVEVPGWALVVSESDTMGWVMTSFLAEPPGPWRS